MVADDKILIDVKVKGTKKARKDLQQVTQTTKTIKKEVKGMQGGFDGAALSILFFGQAMQKAFVDVFKASSATFNEVMHGIEGTVTGFDQMNDSMKFLQFTAGEALEPIAAAMVPVIEATAEWIAANPELFRTIMVVVGALGTFMLLLGTLKLGIGGGVLIWLARAKDAFMALTVAVNTTTIAGIGLMTVLKFVGVLAGIVALTAHIKTMSDNMGGAVEFLKSLVRGLVRFFGLAATGILNVVGIITKGLDFMVNMAIDGINFLIRAINKIPGVNIGEIGKLDLASTVFDAANRLRRSVLEFGTEGIFAPEQGFATGIGDALQGKGAGAAPVTVNNNIMVETGNEQVADEVLAALNRSMVGLNETNFTR